MTHDDARDILPLQALGVLEGAERATLEAHLAECASCRDALAEEVRAVDALAHLPAQVRPRPELKARVMEVATSRGQVVDFPAAGTELPRLGPAKSYGCPMAGRRRGRRGGRDEQRRPDACAGRTHRTARRDRRRGGATGRGRPAHRTSHAEVRVQQQALDVLASPDLVRTTLEGVPPAAGARAQALLSPSRGTLVLSATGLPAPPAGRTYQLWAIVGGRAVSAGVFTPDADGLSRVIATVAFDGPPAALAVTLEPEGGVPQPTGPKVLLGVPAN